MRPIRMRRRMLLLVVGSVLLGSCGSSGRGHAGGEPATGPGLHSPAAPVITSSGGPMPTAVPPANGPVTTQVPATVLDDGGGPELCLGPIALSLPPQCGGPRLTGWRWEDHEGDFVEANGVRWGVFLLTGSFDGTAFSPTTVVRAADVSAPRTDAGPELSMPCPEPDDGWRVVDADRTTEATMDAVLAAASRRPGVADVWLDRSRNPSSSTSVDEPGMTDPRLVTINVRVTRGLGATERHLRKIWGGALCVSRALHTDAELRKVQKRLTRLPGMLRASSGFDHVDVEVVHDDGSLQAWADATYGSGLVRISSALVPASG